ncbi:MAG: hypothetical protein AB7O52_01950 [Planctomycetota bacterium]
MNTKLFFVLVGLLVLLYGIGVTVGVGQKGGSDDVPHWLTDPLGGLLAPFGAELPIESLDLRGDSRLRIDGAARTLHLEASSSSTEEFQISVNPAPGETVRTARLELLPTTIAYDVYFRDALDEESEKEWKRIMAGPGDHRKLDLAVRERGGLLEIKRLSKDAGMIRLID